MGVTYCTVLSPSVATWAASVSVVHSFARVFYSGGSLTVNTVAYYCRLRDLPTAAGLSLAPDDGCSGISAKDRLLGFVSFIPLALAVAALDGSIYPTFDMSTCWCLWTPGNNPQCGSGYMFRFVLFYSSPMCTRVPVQGEKSLLLLFFAQRTVCDRSSI